MFKREAAVVVVGDASETTYAGYTPNGELPAAIQVPFTAAEQQRMAARQFSSTSREAIGLCKVVHVLLEQLPAELLSRQRIQFIGDNQGCISIFQHMRGRTMPPQCAAPPPTRSRSELPWAQTCAGKHRKAS